MKKFLALVLALTMVAMFAISASAATYEALTEEGITENEDVIIKVTPGDTDDDGDIDDDDQPPVEDKDVEKVYKVDITWEDLTFNFISSVAAEDLTYDPETHEYEGIVGEWEKTAAAITVVNHSNAEVEVTSTMDHAGEVTHGVTAALAGEAAKLGSAVGTSGDAVPSVEYTVSVEGTPTILDFTIATVTVAINLPAETEG